MTGRRRMFKQADVAVCQKNVLKFDLFFFTILYDSQWQEGWIKMPLLRCDNWKEKSGHTILGSLKS